MSIEDDISGALGGFPGLAVVESPYLRPGQVMIAALGAVTGWRDVGIMHGPPTITYDTDDDGSPAAEGSRIVHQGLAEEIAWLEAAGVHIPTYGEQQHRAWETARMTFMQEARLSLTIRNPNSDLFRLISGSP
jgi:hypothetical protein